MLTQGAAMEIEIHINQEQLKRRTIGKKIK